MTSIQALTAITFFYLLIVAGAVWQFGPYGLYGGGAVGLAALTFVDTKGGRSGG